MRKPYEEYQKGLISWDEAYQLATNKAVSDDTSKEECHYWFGQAEELANILADEQMSARGYTLTELGQFVKISRETKGIKLLKGFKEKILGTMKEEFMENYHGDQAKYTKIFNGLIRNLVEETDSNPHNEYYRIDVTGWNSEKVDKKDRVNIRNWQFNYAIEYENNPEDWTYELLKLSFIRADVRIVIGYMWNDSRDKEKDIIAEQLKYFRHRVEGIEEFFVIMMNLQLEPEKDDPFGIRIYSILDKSVFEITDTL